MAWIKGGVFDHLLLMVLPVNDTRMLVCWKVGQLTDFEDA